jgi:hypothetical protein
VDVAAIFGRRYGHVECQYSFVFKEISGSTRHHGTKSGQPGYEIFVGPQKCAGAKSTAVVRQGRLRLATKIMYGKEDRLISC